MGGVQTVESRQTLGERVMAARSKLEQDVKVQDERSAQLMSASPSTMQFAFKQVKKSFENYSPFLEHSLMMAWKANQADCKSFVLSACKKVLSAPIKSDEFEWFKQCVLPSSLWMLPSKDDGRYMYQELMAVVEKQSADIVQSMDSVYKHLQSHPKWDSLMAIKEEGAIDRQDHENVGLLRDHGIRGVTTAHELKENNDDGGGLQSFVDSQIGVTALTGTAKRIDREFQRYMENVMGHFGDVKAGPMKKVERCLSKLENDYSEAAYPKCAKLLDVVRCSVTFNTLEQLLVGYQAVVADTKRRSSCVRLARVKNGFLNADYDGGYRDIKVNVVFQSEIHPESKMIVEVQLILSQYLNEKKRIHKLYSIAREKTYFEMVTQSATKTETVAVADVRKLQFEQVLNVGKEIQFKSYSDSAMYKCSMDSDLGLLAMESIGWFGVVDIKEKKPIFELKTGSGSSVHSHHWLTFNQEKFLLVQTALRTISTFKVQRNKDNQYEFIEDKKREIVTDESADYCTVDRQQSHVLFLLKRDTLELRSLSDVKNVKKSIKLHDAVDDDHRANMKLSADGRFCVLASGLRRKYFYVVDILKETQLKMTSEYLDGTFAPCFINDDSQYVSLGDTKGRIEIWDVKNQKPVKSWQIASTKKITSSGSNQNVLAIGSEDKTLRLYDVRNWECFLEKKFGCDGDSLHLTQDFKYITFAGYGQERCDVLKTVI